MSDALAYAYTWKARLNGGVVELNAVTSFTGAELVPMLAGVDGGQLWTGWQQGHPENAGGMDGGDLRNGVAADPLSPQSGDAGEAT